MRLQLENGAADYKRDDDDEEDDEDHAQKRKRRQTNVLKLSTTKISAPSAGFHLLHLVSLTHSNATDNDLEIISRSCRGLSTLDATGCPRIGDTGMKFLIPRPAGGGSGKRSSRSGETTSIHGCPNLKNLYVFHTSVTDAGVAAVIASKLVCTIKSLGVSEHVSAEQISVVRGRGITCTGGRAGRGDGADPREASEREVTEFSFGSFSEVFNISPFWLEDVRDVLLGAFCLKMDGE